MRHLTMQQQQTNSAASFAGRNWTVLTTATGATLQTHIEVPGGIGIAEAVRDNQFVVRTATGYQQIKFTECKIILQHWLNNCPKKYDFVVQAHLLRLQFGLKARAIYELLKLADTTKKFVTSEALVNTTWLSRHAVELEDDAFVLKRLCGSQNWQTYLSDEELKAKIQLLMAQGATRQDVVRKAVMNDFFFPRDSVQQKETFKQFWKEVKLTFRDADRKVSPRGGSRTSFAAAAAAAAASVGESAASSTAPARSTRSSRMKPPAAKRSRPSSSNAVVCARHMPSDPSLPFRSTLVCEFCFEEDVVHLRGVRASGWTAKLGSELSQFVGRFRGKGIHSALAHLIAFDTCATLQPDTAQEFLRHAQAVTEALPLGEQQRAWGHYYVREAQTAQAMGQSAQCDTLLGVARSLLSGSAPASERAYVDVVAGGTLLSCGQFGKASSALEAALEQYVAAGSSSPRDVERCRLLYGLALAKLRDVGVARELLVGAAVFFKEAGDMDSVCRALTGVGELLLLSADAAAPRGGSGGSQQSKPGAASAAASAASAASAAATQAAAACAQLLADAYCVLHNAFSLAALCGCTTLLASAGSQLALCLARQGKSAEARAVTEHCFRRFSETKHTAWYAQFQPVLDLLQQKGVQVAKAAVANATASATGRAESKSGADAAGAQGSGGEMAALSALSAAGAEAEEEESKKRGSLFLASLSRTPALAPEAEGVLQGLLQQRVALPIGSINLDLTSAASLSLGGGGGNVGAPVGGGVGSGSVGGAPLGSGLAGHSLSLLGMGAGLSLGHDLDFDVGDLVRLGSRSRTASLLRTSSITKLFLAATRSFSGDTLPPTSAPAAAAYAGAAAAAQQARPSTSSIAAAAARAISGSPTAATSSAADNGAVDAFDMVAQQSSQITAAADGAAGRQQQGGADTTPQQSAAAQAAQRQLAPHSLAAQGSMSSLELLRSVSIGLL